MMPHHKKAASLQNFQKIMFNYNSSNNNNNIVQSNAKEAEDSLERIHTQSSRSNNSKNN